MHTLGLGLEVAPVAQLHSAAVTQKLTDSLARCVCGNIFFESHESRVTHIAEDRTDTTYYILVCKSITGTTYVIYPIAQLLGLLLVYKRCAGELESVLKVLYGYILLMYNVADLSSPRDTRDTRGIAASRQRTDTRLV